MFVVGTYQTCPQYFYVQWRGHIATGSICICQHFPGLPIDKSVVERRMKLRNSYKESILDEQLFEFYLKMEERDAITRVHNPKKRRGQYTGNSDRTVCCRKIWIGNVIRNVLVGLFQQESG